MVLFYCSQLENDVEKNISRFQCGIVNCQAFSSASVVLIPLQNCRSFKKKEGKKKEAEEIPAHRLGNRWGWNSDR